MQELVNYANKIKIESESEINRLAKENDLLKMQISRYEIDK